MHPLGLFVCFGPRGYLLYLLLALEKQSETFTGGCRAHVDMREKNSTHLDTV